MHPVRGHPLTLEADVPATDRLPGQRRGDTAPLWLRRIQTFTFPAERAGRLPSRIEKAKIQLSTSEQVSVPIPGGEYRQITKVMFEQAIRPQIERVREPIQQCLSDIGSRPTDIDALVMVGGTCKMPAIRGFVSELLGRGPAVGLDPMTAVAEGAAAASAIMAGDLDDRDFFVSTEHALGTIVLDPATGLPFSELIPRNHKLPARATKSYLPVTAYQESLAVEVNEG